ncbi:hypothetical protein MVEG_05025 [Podila verticillata NRRL 6337]|nr:hypothetical protein MVEG_05025 [Podila verticillata NRRL 6337]
MDSTLKNLQEFLATSKELLGAVDIIPLVATSSGSSQKNTSGKSTVEYVACPNNPKNHSRIPQDALEKHLKKCNTAKEKSFVHVGYKPATRLKPVPKSTPFYRDITSNPVATTIVYKDKLSTRQKEMLTPKGIPEESLDQAGALTGAGLFQLHTGPQVYLYDPPLGSSTSSTPMQLRSSKEKSQAYSEHIRLQDLIKTTKELASEPTHSRTDIKGNDSSITRSQVMERVNQIRKRRNLEQRVEREMAKKKLEWDRKKRRQGYKSESRDKKKNAHAQDPSGQEGGEGEEEAIRKALAKGKSGAWAAAIEVFVRDAQLEVTAESELQEELEEQRRGESEADQAQRRTYSEDGRRTKRARSPERSHSSRYRSRSPESHRPRVQQDRRSNEGRPLHGRSGK